MKKLVITTWLMVNFLNVAYSQNLFNWGEKTQMIYAKYGIEPTLVLTGGYAHRFPLQIPDPGNLFVFAELSSPTKLLGTEFYEAKIGSMVPIAFNDNFGVTFFINLSTGHTNNTNFSSQKYAIGHKTLAGIFKEQWHLAFVFEYEHIMANYIQNSTLYKTYVFPEAKDGWYKGAGGNFNLGFEFGYTFTNIIEINVDFKIPRSQKFNSFYGSPAHTNLKIGYRF